MYTGLTSSCALFGLISSLAAASNSFSPAGVQSVLQDTAMSQKSPFTKHLSNYVERVMEDWKVPGLALAVIDGDDIFTEAFGYAELPGVKATTETLFFAGSTTKALTAAALADMIDSKHFSSLNDNGWNTPISRLIPDDFKLLNDDWASENLSLDDAVSHRTGLAPHDLAWARLATPEGEPLSIRDMVKRLRGLELSASPRTTWSYTHLMYVVLSHVVETLTGEWLGDYLQRKIFKPLNMTSTYCSTEAALEAPEKLASGYFWDEQKQEYLLLEFDEVRPGTGAGFVISNVNDYAKWIKCLLDESAPFSRSTHADIKTPRMIAAREPRSGLDESLYSLGWKRKSAHGAIVYMHGGTEVAYATQVFWLPEHKYGIVALANVAAPGNAAEETIAWKLIEDKLGVPEEQRFKISESFRKDDERDAEELKNAVDILYPDRPHPRMPSLVNTSQIAGWYFNEGYGPMHVEKDKSGSHETMAMRAQRDDMLFMYTLRFKHVSGSSWLIEVWYEDTNSMADFWGCEIITEDQSREVSGLQVKLSDRGEGGLHEGNVFFRRLKGKMELFEQRKRIECAASSYGCA